MSSQASECLKQGEVYNPLAVSYLPASLFLSQVPVIIEFRCDQCNRTHDTGNKRFNFL
jgi:hypothetical protein